MDPELTCTSFAPHAGTSFDAPDAGIALILDDVVELGQAHAPGFREPFALRFSGPREHQLEQRIHRLVHADLGDLEVFLVPTGPGRYEAVFS